MLLNREKARAEILETVRQMAKTYPASSYEEARERFGLLGRIKRICRNAMPTARLCWEYVGLDRSKLVDEFFIAQKDIRTANRPPLYPHQEQALEALRTTNRMILQIR